MKSAAKTMFSRYDGLPTRRKLDMLSRERGLPESLHDFINEMKQIYTMEAVSLNCRPFFPHEYALSRLACLGYRLALASNSIRVTVETMIGRAALTPYMDFMLSNEDVSQPKPDPEIYRKAIAMLGLRPQEVLVVEDNDKGVAAARGAGAHLLVVETVAEVNLDNILREIRRIDAKGLDTERLVCA